MMKKSSLFKIGNKFYTKYTGLPPPRYAHLRYNPKDYNWALRNHL